MADATRSSGSRPLPHLITALARHRAVLHATIDVAAWAIGLTVATALRFDFSFDPDSWSGFTVSGLLAAIVIASVLQVLSGLATGLYVGRWRFGSFEEVRIVFNATLIPTAILFVANLTVLDRMLPNGVVILGGILALGLMCSVRYAWRLALEKRLRPSEDTATKVLVFGAGEGGFQLLGSMLRNPDSTFLPVALLDDDPAKQKLRLLGVPVAGDRHAIGEVAARTGARMMVIAIPGATSDVVREVSALAVDQGLEVRSLPPVAELLGGPVDIADVRPITPSDLLGRHVIDTDLDSIAGYLTGRRVLVTGAGGSIGSELCAQVVRFAPAELVMLDRDESALHAVQLRIEGRAMLDDRNLVVCDIRDRARVAEVFDEHRPEVVFHAAALKHLPLLEMHPSEAVKTNVYGSWSLLDLAAERGVDRFINISTDKAADPTSVLGYTKRIAEMLTAEVASRTPGTFLSVRFGNVLGSRGSVLTAFQSQIAAGGPVTVTDPEVTRYFMTVEEAVQLVIQAGAVGNDGEVLVLDMGTPVRIDDVARQLVSQAPRKVDIAYTGLRPGEKLHEVLFGEGEVDERPAHPLISQVPVPALGIDAVERSLGGARGDDALVEQLAALCSARDSLSPSAGD